MPCKISFPNTNYKPITLSERTPLAEVLTIQNSPVLFGCRTGICGTCLVTVTGNVPPAEPDEQELLDLLAPDCSSARLACQLDITHDLKLCPYGNTRHYTDSV